MLVVTPGDPDGIGPEVVWKTLKTRPKSARPLLCVGARIPFDRLGAKVVEIRLEELLALKRPPRLPRGAIWLLAAPKRTPRRGLHLAGFQSGWSIETATRLVLSGVCSGLVTGPISKERLNAGGYPYPGHTEFLAALCAQGQTPSKREALELARTANSNVTMMLANDQLRISLVTTHLALKDVPRALNRENITRAIEHTVAHLKQKERIARPRVAIAALNPHAGESGMFGKEEVRLIGPTVARLRKSYGGSVHLSGPLPADTLFALHRAENLYDAVVCMYHDQGLIPVKLLDFPNTVNITLGLPIVRTSVDHGTGFDIAGRGMADPSSFKSAVQMAERFTRGPKS